MQQQKQSQATSGFRKMRDNGAVLASFPALTQIVLFHKDVGFRTLGLFQLYFTAFVLWVFNGIGNFHISLPVAGTFGAHHQDNSLEYFGLVVLVWGLWQRRRQWRALLRGEHWHTLSRGVSRFEFLPIRRDLVYRLVDPGIGFLAGLCVRKIGFGGLGLWLMFSAVCLRIVEEYARDRQVEHDLDALDNLLEAKLHADTVAHFEGQTRERSLRETGGIPTGADAGLEAEIARRKRAAEGRS